jgi:hypothetical protein
VYVSGLLLLEILLISASEPGGSLDCLKVERELCCILRKLVARIVNHLLMVQTLGANITGWE